MEIYAVLFYHTGSHQVKKIGVGECAIWIFILVITEIYMQIPIRLGNTGTNVPHWIAIWIYTNSCFTEPDKTFLNKAVQVNAIDFTLY